MMLELILVPFEHEFMRASLQVALLLAVLCGSLGVLLVPRGLSMLGDGLAHATFGGVGLGLFGGLMVDSATWVALPFSIFVGLGIVWLGRHTKLAGDAALGVFFAVSLAIGITALHTASRSGVGIDIESVLFGSILAVQPGELRWIAIVGIFIFALIWRFAPRIAYAGFYPELASLGGVRVIMKEYLLMVITAVVTVLAVKAVGVMLVSAWLVIPASIGRHLARRLGMMLLCAVLTALLGSGIGIVASYYYDVPGGAAMTLSLGFLFVLSLIGKSILTFTRVQQRS